MASTNVDNTMGPGTLTSRTVQYRLQFVLETGGIRLELIHRTLGFLNILITKHLRLTLNSDPILKGKNISITAFDLESDIIGLCIDGEEHVVAPQPLASYCGVVATTISTIQSHGDTDAEVVLALSYKDLIDFTITQQVENYIGSGAFPEFLDQLQLTYIEPRWEFTRQVHLCLKGGILTGMSTVQQNGFERAMADFLSSPSSSRPILAEMTKNSVVSIMQQKLVSGEDRPSVEGRHSTNMYAVNTQHILEVDLAFLKKMHVPSLVGNDTLPSYEASVLTRLNTERENFLRHLHNHDPFFPNVTEAWTTVVQNRSVPANPNGMLLKRDGERPGYAASSRAFNIQFATVLVTLVPVVVLSLGGAIAAVRYCQKTKHDKIALTEKGMHKSNSECAEA